MEGGGKETQKALCAINFQSLEHNTGVFTLILVNTVIDPDKQILFA